MKINFISSFYIFQDKKIELKNKNFIFSKNGSGKSTLCNLTKLSRHFIKIETYENEQLIEKVENGKNFI
ncbi:hypothetical protein [Enterococcus malodoratus]|uniref:Protein CR006 P-loop domain-containing protein n=1 Tax=Enterococcus malodoratus ATCC 43197 TaxID=1158601 RepID=R2QYD3_9ENTE|nr:hypothetical protein [Enterococcus malodoratus]EOH73426.1 hypothetical protein UAI_03617 [Enterococcus malodoratus ATCC 43197]EOT67279.1 hypothetical protein I585_02800 [Enterococcus malodoratus ATCC 43197]SPX03264.1 Uncharacterized protein conserved in bacteria [Enterococcus malodoratus]STD69469.1 Uncharacterized protein conserved in bacteria [Enterococcus malodoratus]